MTDEIAGLIAAVRVEERERCAKVADEEARLWAQDCVADVPEAMQTLAAAIRALGDE
jgi:hypothetical protein